MADNFEPATDDRPTLTALAARLGRLPAEKRRAAVEVSASLAGVSLRVSGAFVAAVPKAAKILSADEIRSWGELGRRLAMGSAETGVSFFTAGASSLAGLPAPARSLALQLCMRQLILSSSVAVETLRLIPDFVTALADDALIQNFLKLAVEVAGRSAKHSAEFLEHSAAVGEALARYGDEREIAASASVRLAGAFVVRTGGMTADLWATLPRSLELVTATEAARLMDAAAGFLDFGGSVTLQFISAGARVLSGGAFAFDAWTQLLKIVARQGNAVLIAFLRATPKVFEDLKVATTTSSATADDITGRVLGLIAKLAESDAESALAAFRSSGTALSKVPFEQFETWIEGGFSDMVESPLKARRSYFALETRQSRAALKNLRKGTTLESVQNVLRVYVEGLTGSEIEVLPVAAMSDGARIGNGRTIYLPGAVAEFEDDDQNFKLYKVLAAYGAGQIEFGTFAENTVELAAAFRSIADHFAATADQRDAFSLAGYIENVAEGESALPEAEIERQDELRRAKPPATVGYKALLGLFPDARLAGRVFATMENARIDHLLRLNYRGIRKDLDLMRENLRSRRPYIFDLPAHEVAFELLFQITVCGGATDDARRFYGQIVSEIETAVVDYLQFARGGGLPTVADSLLATRRVYDLFQNVDAGQQNPSESDDEQDAEHFANDAAAREAAVVEKIRGERSPDTLRDVRDLFNAWNSSDDGSEPDDLQGSEAWTQCEVPEHGLQADEVAFAYDEWDRELNDYRVGWSRVIEKRVKTGDRTFVEIARSRYRGVISSIRHQFQLMKPENLTRVNREIDGEDYDLNALVDFVIDRRADGRQTENIYTKRLRRRRDVAVSILLDQSSSTARTITRNPLQPYTFPGRRIIEIEKEGIVLMSEALEAVGDIYSINGFTSEGRRNVKFYVVKDFDEKYSDEVERRIGGITFENNTRLGSAIRHASARLLRQDSRTKLLIVLTDGRPYDHDYGDARYAREDVREALVEAKSMGVTPFCITIDRESEAELRDLYGDVGYTIIDDVLSLPERMPNIYRRLTS